MIFNQSGGSSQTKPLIETDSNNRISQIFPQLTYTTSLTNDEGVSLPSNLVVTTASLVKIATAFKKWVIPAYFTRLNFYYDLALNHTPLSNIMSSLKEIEASILTTPVASGTVGWSVSQLFSGIEKITMHEVTDWSLNVDSEVCLTNVLVYDMPKCVSFTATKPGGTSEHYVDVTGSNFPLCQTFFTSSTAAIESNRFWVGTLVLPACTTLQNFKRPESSDGFTLRTPLLEKQTVGAALNYSGGPLHWYIGPNLQTLACASNVTGYSPIVDIHIPAGDSTTKSTLDDLGVPYTQDYEWEADAS